MPPPPAAHGTTNRWRTGCRCDRCGEAHNAAHHRHKAADARFPQRARRKLLRLLARGTAITDAAEQVGVTVQTVHFRTRIDPAWQELLDQALITGRDPEVPHGSPTGYRHYRCRCPECRAAHHPTSG